MPVSDMDPAQAGLPVPLGLRKAEGGFPHLLHPSLNSRGLTDRLNDTVGVTACLRLIFRCD